MKKDQNRVLMMAMAVPGLMICLAMLIIGCILHADPSKVISVGLLLAGCVALILAGWFDWAAKPMFQKQFKLRLVREQGRWRMRSCQPLPDPEGYRLLQFGSLSLFLGLVSIFLIGEGVLHFNNTALIVMEVIAMASMLAMIIGTTIKIAIENDQEK